MGSAGPYGLLSQLSSEKSFLKKEDEHEPSQYEGSGQEGLRIKIACFGLGWGKFCPKLTKAAGVWQFPSCAEGPPVPPESMVRACICVLSQYGKPSKSIHVQDWDWEKAAFLLRNVSSTCNGKALNKWLVKASSSVYDLDRRQWGGRLQTVSPARQWGRRLLHSHYNRGKSTFLAWIIWKLWISPLFLFQWATDKSCVR